jgi:hypothetical protein
MVEFQKWRKSRDKKAPSRRGWRLGLALVINPGKALFGRGAHNDLDLFSA